MAKELAELEMSLLSEAKTMNAHGRADFRPSVSRQCVGFAENQSFRSRISPRMTTILRKYRMRIII